MSVAVLAWSGFGAMLMGLMYFSAGNHSAAFMWACISVIFLGGATLAALFRRRL